MKYKNKCDIQMSNLDKDNYVRDSQGNVMRKKFDTSEVAERDSLIDQSRTARKTANIFLAVTIVCVLSIVFIFTSILTQIIAIELDWFWGTIVLVLGAIATGSSFLYSDKIEESDRLSGEYSNQKPL